MRVWYQGRTATGLTKANISRPRTPDTGGAVSTRLGNGYPCEPGEHFEHFRHLDTGGFVAVRGLGRVPRGCMAPSGNGGA